MKRSILCILAATLAMFAGASPVTLSQARMVAGAWAAKNVSFGFAGEPVAGGTRAHKDANGVKLWYEVPMSDGSCLIVSPVTELDPVIVALEDIPSVETATNHPVRAMLEVDMTDRLKKLGLYVANSGASLMGASASSVERSPLMEKWARQGEARWARYGVGTGAQLTASVKDKLDEIATEISVVKGFEKKGPLTHWNQGDRAGGYCYNLYTPEHSVCGCVATAMAAMMQFFGAKKGPENAAGVATATFNGSPTDADGAPFRTIGGTYDWSLFDDKTQLDDYNHLTDDQRDLLGRVAYDCGVAVGMAWTLGSSGALEANIASGLKKLFGFKDARAVGARADQYAKLIYNQCRAGAPVGLGISKEGESGGHSVLAVGYGMDEDGNSRVRIFTGWGGSGDGWYCLPYIDTNGTLDGDTVSYDVVSEVVTMVGYETDETVPVVGQMIPGSSGLDITVPGVEEEVQTYDDDGNPVTETVGYKTLKTVGNGYFATRVSASAMAGQEIKVCYSNASEGVVYESATVEVGDNVVAADTAAALCEALPDDIMFILLRNTSYALSFNKAIEIAKAENKAILRVSTDGSDTNVVGQLAKELIDHIMVLDKANGDGAGFADRFVYQPIEASSSAERDGLITFGVFLPDDATPSDRWAWYNARLSYGYSFFAVDDIAVTDEDGVDVAYDDFGEAISNNFNSVTNDGFSATYLVKGASVATNDVTFTYDGDGMKSALQLVLDMGWEEYTRETADIVLTVAGDPAETGIPEPAFGVYTNKFAAGEEIAISSPGLQTNETLGVVFDYSSGVLEVSNTVSGATSTTTISGSTTLSFVAGDVATLVWSGVASAVRIAVVDKDEGGTSVRYGTEESASGWYPYGGTVTLRAIPNENYAFSHWTYADGDLAYELGDNVVAQPVLTFTAYESAVLMACYDLRDEDDKAADLAKGLATNHVLKVASIDYGNWPYFFYDERSYLSDALLMSGSEVPATSVTALHDGSVTTVSAGGEASLAQVPSLAEVATASLTNSSGKVYECVGWILYSVDVETNAAAKVVTNVTEIAQGTTENAAFTLDRDATLCWVWYASGSDVDPRPDEREPAQVPLADDGVSSPLTIYPNGDGTLTVEAVVGNAVKGWWYVLKSAADISGPYEKASTSADSDAVAVFAEDNGSLTLRTTFTPTDAKRFYRVSVEGEEP